ncbi:MAG: PIN domain-containing protein [Planctomycetes bacterium]|nr:PIN domain-containing protein [Planctomycetota bacterium]
MRIYLDTTIPNYYFNEHTPDKQKAAHKLFALLKTGNFDGYISDVVLRELMKTAEVIRQRKMVTLVKELSVLEVTQECIRLADEYIKNNIIPALNRDDALHIALASIYGIDFLVSYNFEHIVKVRTIDRVTGVNLLCGYKTPRIVSPEEVLDV